MENKREGFIFYHSFWEAINELPEINQLELYRAIADYSFTLQEPELIGLSKTIWILIKPQIQANNRRYLNGKKPKTKQEESKTEANDKQEESKTEGKEKEKEKEKDNIKEESKKYLEAWNEFFKRKYKITEDYIEAYVKIRKKYSKEDILIGTQNYLKKVNSSNRNKEEREQYELHILKFLQQKSNGLPNFL